MRVRFTLWFVESLLSSDYNVINVLKCADNFEHTVCDAELCPEAS